MMNLMRILLGFILICWGSVSLAESKIRFQHLSREDGLSQSFVLSVTQDRDGFMWFGTQSGLNRFDGYDVRVFQKSDASGSLPDNVVRDLLTDSKGRLWVATDNGGVALYQYDTESFQVFDQNTSALTTNRIRTIKEHSSGKILIGTDGAGVWLFDEGTNLFVPLLADGLLANRSVWAIEELSDSILVGTSSGLVETDLDGLRKATLATHIQNLFDQVHVRSILRDAEGVLWFATDSKGVYRIYGDNQVQQFEFGAEQGGLAGPQVFRLLEDGAGDIWIATSSGLNRYNNGELFTYQNQPIDNWSLGNNMVVDAFESRDGVVWLGTYAGVSFWPRSEYVADHVFASGEGEKELGSNAITSFAETANGDLWVGTISGGLNRVDSLGNIETYNPQSAIALPSDDVMSLFVDSSDRLWVGTRSAGLFQFDGDQGVVRSFSQQSNEPYQLSANAITRITESSYGALLVSTYGGGFNEINLADFQVTQFEASSLPGGLPTNRIMTIKEDSTGGIWLGTDGSGLVHYDRHRQQFTQYVGGTAGFEGDLVLTLAEDLEGSLWFGTISNGVYVLPRSNRTVDGFQFESYSSSNGLLSDSIYSIEVDANNGIWFSSNAGLTQLSSRGLFRHFGQKNGLQDLEFNVGASLKLAGGALVFGGINGFNLVTPSEIEWNSVKPKPAITSVQRQGISIPMFEANRSGVELEYRDSFLEFSFAALDFSHLGHSQYRYRLLGLQDDWVEAGSRRYVSYNNLLAGEYTFEVQAADRDGVWSSETARLGVIVRPAPWLTNWAYGLYVIVFLALAIGAIGLLRSKQRHVTQIEAINEQLSKEIEDRVDAENEIRNQRERTQRYIDVAEVMLVSLDVEGAILNLNEKSKSLLALREKDSGNILDFVNVRHRTDMRQKILSVFDETDDGELLESEIISPNGDIHVVVWRFAPIAEVGGHAQMILASGTDITALRQLEKAVRFKEKLSALGTLSSGIAHDFNNILTAITGYNDLALARVAKGSEVESFLQKVEQASRRATNLVNRISAVTQIDSGQLSRVDVVATLKGALELLRETFPTDIELIQHHPDHAVYLEADPTQLHQLVINLGSNAANAIGNDRGKFDVSLEHKYLSTEELPTGSDLEEGDYIVMHFRDSGRGMPEAMKQKIFDPFYSTDDLGDAASGTGLGLSIVHGIVLNHKGYISVESHLGIGTHFSIYLPGGTVEVHDRIVPLLSAKSTNKKVLIVDDEEWIVDLASQLVTSLGVEVEAFVHPMEALERYRSGPKDFAAIITDQNMPGLKGVELIAALRKIDSDVQVILMSGNVSPLEEGDPAHFMAKPFRLAELKDALVLVNAIASEDSNQQLS